MLTLAYVTLSQGYVIVTDFFEKEDLQPLLKDLDVLVDNLAEKLYNAGKIKGSF